LYTRSLRLISALMAIVLILSICFSAFAYDTIPFGEESAQVKTLQKALRSKGYYKGTVDGKFGQKTRSAVYRYQKAIGLTPDGKAGNKTLTALYDGTTALNTIDQDKKGTITAKKANTLYYGCTGDSVKSLQRSLRKAGYFKGSIDGKFGETTLVAVKRFQWAVGLNGDGKAGTKTLKALKTALAK